MVAMEYEKILTYVLFLLQAEISVNSLLENIRAAPLSVDASMLSRFVRFCCGCVCVLSDDQSFFMLGVHCAKCKAEIP